MQNLNTLIVDDIEHSAEWRWKIACEYPHDADRNLEAAARLARIAADLKKEEGSQWHLQLQALCAASSERYCETLSELIRSVGFRSSAETGAEFLFELFLLAGYAWDPDGNFVR
jgi:hypothetical protein